MEYTADWEQRIDYAKLRKQRTNRLGKLMQHYKLDALLSFNADHIRYMSGFRPLWWPIPTHALTRNAAIFVPGKAPVLLVPGPDYPRVKATMGWLPSDHIQILYHLEQEKDVSKTVKEQFQPFLSQFGINAGRVGVEVATPFLLDELRRVMPKIEWVDSNRFFREVKLIKTDEEMKCMRLTAIMAELGIEQGMRTIKAGTRDCEVLGEALGRMYAFGMEVTQCSEIVASGEFTAPLYRFASDKLIRQGDLVFMDIGGCFNGYFSDHTRTVVLGKPNDEQKKIYTAVYDAMMAVHEYMKPGNTNKDVYVAAGKSIEKHGLRTTGDKVRVSYIGHTIGISGNESPRLNDEPPFELKPGMVFAIEPGVYVSGVPGGGGVRIEDMILITKNGNEILTRTPYCDKLLGNGYCGGPCEGCGS